MLYKNIDCKWKTNKQTNIDCKLWRSYCKNKMANKPMVEIKCNHFFNINLKEKEHIGNQKLNSKMVDVNPDTLIITVNENGPDTTIKK